MRHEISFDGGVPNCYAGKILRIDLTNKRSEIVPTAKYLPKYIGGRAMANRIFWDEVKEAVPALDPRNKLIFMTGPCNGVGLPYAGKCVMTGIGAKEIPEQYTHAAIGGFFGTMLKWAGYDGFILEGKADEHTYVYINDDKVEFLNADWLWGTSVQDSQKMLREKYIGDTYSLVIGQAGENLHRHATITTGADSVLAKPGFGAVFGAKNLKAIAVHGTGSVAPGDIHKVFEIRRWPDNPKAYVPRPVVFKDTFGYEGTSEFKVAPHVEGKLSCSVGCSHSCMATMFDVEDPLDPEKKISMVGKCIDSFATCMLSDAGDALACSIHSKRQEKPGTYKWFGPTFTDATDPDLEIISEAYPGDTVSLWGPNFKVGCMINWLCNVYGLDKWDIMYWYFTWLVMAKREGLLDDMDFGMEIDMENPEFVKHFIDMMVFRKGEMGELFADGIGRAIRKLGKGKYGDSIYHGRIQTVTGKALDIPVSWESSWGECAHWQGRGEGGCHKFDWVSYNLTDMIGSRDELGSAHMHDWVENYLSYKDDPCHSKALMLQTLANNRRAEMKDSLLLCEYKDPEPCRPELEAEMYYAATGVKGVTPEDMDYAADAGRLMERAIFIRTFGRTRDMEVEMMYPFMTYPDPYGETVDWEEWNDAVDLFYEVSGWDKKTGWPTRETWEKYGLKDVADELESIGKLPDPGAEYTRKPCPFDGARRISE